MSILVFKRSKKICASEKAGKDVYRHVIISQIMQENGGKVK